MTIYDYNLYKGTCTEGRESAPADISLSRLTPGTCLFPRNHKRGIFTVLKILPLGNQNRRNSRVGIPTLDDRSSSI